MFLKDTDLPVYRTPRPIRETPENMTFFADYQNFLRNKKCHPHRRGYILHGPPGCGKCSAVEYVAALPNSVIYMVTLNMEGMGDALLARTVADVPEHSIILFEGGLGCSDGNRALSETEPHYASGTLECH